ncbi:PAS-domain containing protein, partial [Acinetobacter nosocomialis]|uniref:PAS-domain containing protein n=1 Tax=Acinetobacter nosocomialis TaxID=106654 RepID=UPI001490785E
SHMSQGLGLFDPAGRLVLANRRLNEIFDLAPDAVPAGTTFQELFNHIAAASGGSPLEAARIHQRHRALIAARDG